MIFGVASHPPSTISGLDAVLRRSSGVYGCKFETLSVRDSSAFARRMISIRPHQSFNDLILDEKMLY